MFGQLGQISELIEKLQDVDPDKMQNFAGTILMQFLASMVVRAAQARPVPLGYLQQMSAQGYDHEAASALYRFVLEEAVKQDDGSSIPQLTGGQ